ncbi:hypothetical protein SAMN06265171_102670 [Chryseobacterium rhizoplanae]|uniref:Uncharacterized protein n=1 Tax=Chryseobacterium rhizoplanae TaxID=1609531 RepID=A0A521CB69_9FLAO|nr:tetratricopeptide repeat-containing sensor histidine kinase [Chryseobacterium rhizoplanae]SMO56702.1 hypothetical protein SAMN06265171_102670 [Chryseobacterium rhizoplanae]
MIRYLLFLLIILVSCKEKTETNYLAKADQLYNKGTNLLLKNNLEAYSKFQQALNYYYKAKDSSNISKSLICQAIAQKYTGDIFGAETTLVDALNFMKEGDESLYSVYNTLGDIKYDQKEYSSATEWYNKALAEKNESIEKKYTILNNKAASEYRQGQYSSALKALQSIDLLKIKDVNLQNRIKENIVYTRWLQDKNYPAHSEFKKLLTQKLQQNDNWGANSSYSHLAEIYQQTNPAISLFYAKQMLNTAEKIKSPEDRLEAIERISFVDKPSNAISNFIQYKTLSDSIQNYKNANRNRFAYIKYDSEKKETENQRLKVDQAQKENQLIRQQAALAVAIIAIVIIVILYRRRQARLKQENELKLKNDQLRISKRVHDVVANGIYQVMTKIENQEHFDKENALDELEFVYEKSRDISYEKHDPENDKKNHRDRISTLIASFKNEVIDTYIVGNENEIWNGISQPPFEDIYQVIRELLVNMKKHSRASRVIFKFKRINNIIKIQYTDDGIGIPGAMIYKNGLTNTETRIAAIRGEIIFDNKSEKGLKVSISFPVS